MGFAYPIDSKVVTNPNGTVDYDRASSSAQLRGLIKSMITNGVNLTESTNLQVMADEETMNLTVKPGYVIIEGALKHFEDDVKVTIGAADTTNPRIDTIVARLNLNEDVRDIVIDVLQGTPNVEPVAPELTRTTSYYEVGLADILVEVDATQLSQDVITDTRLLNSRCGMISAIGEIDTETLFNQLTTDFDNWFESIKGKLGDDVAGDLQIQIDGLADDIDTLQEDVGTLTPRVETLENEAYDTLIWNISDDFKVKLSNVAKYTLQSGINPEWHELCMVGDELHELTYNSSYTRHYKYDVDGKRTQIRTWDSYKQGAFWRYNSSFQYFAHFCEYKGELYATTCGGTWQVYLAKFNKDTSNWENLFEVATGTSNYNATAYPIVFNDKLYVVCAYGLYLRIAEVNEEFTELINTKSLYTGSGTNYCVLVGNVVTSGEYIIIPYNYASQKRLGIYNINNGEIINLSFEAVDSCMSVLAKNKLLTPIISGHYFDVCDISSKNSLELAANTIKKIITNTNYFVTSDFKVYEGQVYRVATSYAKKGNKIYLADNSFAISDNLEEIDNGYLITADGEVKIGIYE